MNGTTYKNGFTCGTSRDPREQVWILGRKAVQLEGIVGIVDSSEPGINVIVRILGDGKELYSSNVSYGTTFAVDNVNITGVLRLSVQVQLADPNAASAPQVGFGDLTIAGAEADLVALVAQ